MQLWTTRKQDTRTYFGVVCHKCRSPILFGVDRSAGSGPIRPAATLRLTCGETACGWQGDYTRAPVARYRKGSEGAKAVVVPEEK
jgi:hypothetical protein